MLEWKRSAIEVVRKMADSMFEKFKKYWSRSCLILAVAFVLNPGFMLKFVENYYSIIYGEYESAFQTKKVRETMIEIYSEYSPPATNPLTTSQPLSSGSSQQQILLPNPLSSSKFMRFECWYQVEGIGKTQYASTCSIPDDIDSRANDELNDDDDYCSTIGISP
ncbi:hypothetical protein FRX31_003770 [Thalictrum thalictroides]|uniref:hAT-like transposase RNase-H fold domain-containing protein n=1 Tax=Thalictrum thalictroides TaxID=46969 RepID=A0A7J6XAZ1_THATH|nr:hypothetical protein FRX31_003770 [Thalictrum thalictroides]